MEKGKVVLLFVVVVILIIILLANVYVAFDKESKESESVDTVSDDTPAEDTRYYYYDNITVVNAEYENLTITGANNKKTGYMLRGYIESNSSKYYLHQRSNITELIGKKLSIKYYYPNVDFYFNSFREELEFNIEPIELQAYLYSYSIVPDPVIDYAYLQFKEHFRELRHGFKINIDNPDIVLPVLDRYGRNIHYETSFKVEVTNLCNVSTYLITNNTDFNIYNPRISGILPSALTNNHFVLTYPDVIEHEAHETKEYTFNIETYGSGANQIFFPKEYTVRFVISNGFVVSCFTVNIILEDMKNGGCVRWE